MNCFHFLRILLLLILSWSPTGFCTYGLKPAFPNLTFIRPVDFQITPHHPKHVFVVEQRGIIYAVVHSTHSKLKKIFLDIRHKVRSTGNEQGLLGLAFHPKFHTNGFFYVNYTRKPTGDTVVERYNARTSLKGDPKSGFVILNIPQPYSNHNGGQIAFGPDGYLYIAVGDGGWAGDPHRHGQNPQTLLGSILRISVDGSKKPYSIPNGNPFHGKPKLGRPEIYAYGLRNPWRFSFDAKLGTLWTGDVGQNKVEEIHQIEKGKNYGWAVWEGDRCFRSKKCKNTGFTPPIHTYTHAQGKSITGGVVYRGSHHPKLVGTYLYADYVSGRHWALKHAEHRNENIDLLQNRFHTAAFGVDHQNEVYLCVFHRLDGRTGHILTLQK